MSDLLLSPVTVPAPVCHGPRLPTSSDLQGMLRSIAPVYVLGYCGPWLNRSGLRTAGHVDTRRAPAPADTVGAWS